MNGPEKGPAPDITPDPQPPEYPPLAPWRGYPMFSRNFRELWRGGQRGSRFRANMLHELATAMTSLCDWEHDGSAGPEDVKHLLARAADSFQNAQELLGEAGVSDKKLERIRQRRKNGGPTDEERE